MTLLESADGEGGGGDVLLDHGEEAGSGEDAVEVEQAARGLLGLPGLAMCPSPVGILPMDMQPLCRMDIWLLATLCMSHYGTLFLLVLLKPVTASALKGLVASTIQLNNVATHRALETDKATAAPEATHHHHTISTNISA